MLFGTMRFFNTCAGKEEEYLHRRNLVSELNRIWTFSGKLFLIFVIKYKESDMRTSVFVLKESSGHFV